MRARLRTYLPVIILLILGLWILKGAFGPALWNPNNHLLGKSADGLKNYFTPAWYLKYDSGLHFSGMNYPYGDHVIFTDNQPLVSWTFKLFQPIWPEMGDHAVGILNTLVFLSYLLCLLLLYAIGRRLYLPAWYAIPIAVLFTFLSPQMHRFAGHYALAYPAFIPLVWYLLIRFSESKNNWIWYVALLSILIGASFIHLYYLLMGGLFAFLFIGIGGLKWRHSDRKKMIRQLGLGLGLLAIPIVFIQVFMGVTDSIGDRPSNPWGFFVFFANLKSVFLPVQGPLWEAWTRFASGPRPTVEGYAYVGLAATWIGILGLIRAVQRIFGPRSFRGLFKAALPGQLSVALWAASLLLLFSFCIPFKWGLEFLVDWIKTLRQFRALGRFAWVFYYVFTMYAAVYLYLLYRRLKQKGLLKIGIGMIAVAFIMWGWDMAIHVDIHAKVVRNAAGDNALANKEPDFVSWLAEVDRKVDDFQAILPVAGFHIGSDKFNPPHPSEPLYARTYKLALNTGLPIACGSMSRTSIQQSAKLLQLYSKPLIYKDLLEELPSDKPFLVLREFEAALRWNEQLFLEQANMLIRKGRFALYELPLDNMKGHQKKHLEYFESHKDSLYQHERGLLLTDSAFVYYNGFDKGQISAFGTESLHTDTDDPLMLFDGQPGDTVRFEASVWVKLDPDAMGLPVFYFREYNAKGEQIAFHEMGLMFEMDVFQAHIRANYEFIPQQLDSRIQIWIQYKQPEVESFLLRPLDVDVYLPGFSPYPLMYNNYYLAE